MVKNHINFILLTVCGILHSFVLECDHISHNDIGHSKTISATAKNHVSHTKNSYRPQIILATPCRLQNVSHLIISSLHAYVIVSNVSVSYSIYLSDLVVVIDGLRHSLQLIKISKTLSCNHKDNEKMHKTSTTVQSNCRLEVIAACRVESRRGATLQSEYLDHTLPTSR